MEVRRRHHAGDLGGSRRQQGQRGEREESSEGTFHMMREAKVTGRRASGCENREIRTGPGS